MIVKTGREEEIKETVKPGRIQRTDKCKYLGITILMDGHLTGHIKGLNTRCDIINRELCANASPPVWDGSLEKIL